MTSVLRQRGGALVLTGYLGGAVASQLRVGAPLLSQILFPIMSQRSCGGGCTSGTRGSGRCFESDPDPARLS